MTFAFVVLVFVGCASSNPGNQDAGPTDAASAVDSGTDVDAPPDAAVTTPPRPGRDIVSAGGRIRGGTVTMDVEIGFPVDQSESTNGTRRMRGAAVVNP
jgi:hypothetical protein